MLEGELNLNNCRYLFRMCNMICNMMEQCLGISGDLHHVVEKANGYIFFKADCR